MVNGDYGRKKPIGRWYFGVSGEINLKAVNNPALICAYWLPSDENDGLGHCLPYRT
jgi:hypothetical protein